MLQGITTLGYNHRLDRLTNIVKGNQEVVSMRTRKSTGNLRSLLRLNIAAGVIGATLAMQSTTPAYATSGDLFAYAAGRAHARINCPQTNIAKNKCTLTEALAHVPAGGPVLLATSGSVRSYYGNFAITTPGTSAASPIRIAPAGGATNPTLDGDASGRVKCPTAACNGAVVTIGSGVAASLKLLTITDGNNSGSGIGGGFENLGASHLQGVTITRCAANTGGAIAVGSGASLNASALTSSHGAPPCKVVAP